MGIVDHYTDVNLVGDIGIKTDKVILVGVVKERKVNLKAYCAQILCAFGIVYGVEGVFGFECANYFCIWASGVDDGAKQMRPLVIAHVRPFTHRCRCFKCGGSGPQTIGDPPLCDFGGACEIKL